ncbi:N-acetylmuramoyl-L-alanine amidase family protein [Tenacibaculum sp. 190524A05c]|uniref:N-acetylmuramoyl-L-alanine amidase n=1 Tax=Tenacibaculum platacis TaxID=3137852 RepID=A0ABP1EX27_9FLAO
MQFLKFSKYKSNISSLCFVLFSIFFISNHFEVNAQKKYTVVLDAGHGGKDPGNLGNGYKESIIALKVVLEVGKKLKKNKEINVIFTRNKDVFVELHNRAKIANDSKADLFVSVHCDSYTNPRAHGAGTFVLGLSGNKQNLEIAKRENSVILLEDNYKQNYDYDPNSPESVISLSMLQEENLDESLEFASIVQKNFRTAKRFGRSVKQNNFLVLRETVMPSVLIELGFLTNKAEGKFLNSSSGQIRMAGAIAQGIERYVERLKLNTLEEKKAANKGNVEKKKKNSVALVTVVERKKTYERNTKPKSNLDSKDFKVVVTPPKKKVTEVKSVKKPETKKSNPKENSPKVTPPKKEIKEAVVVKKEEPKPKTTPSKKVAESVKKESNKPEKIEFKVQIAASKRYLSQDNFNFRGLENVEVLVIDEYYKYYYGSSESFKKAKAALVKAREAGHKDAFIVAFADGTKISVREALKKQ